MVYYNVMIGGTRVDFGRDRNQERDSYDMQMVRFSKENFEMD